jgi:HK97 family phage major capsid protein
MQDTEIQLENNSLNGLLRGIETKSTITGAINNASHHTTMIDRPWFFDYKTNEENFFLKHAQVIETSLSTINITESSSIKPSWSSPVEAVQFNENTFNEKITTHSVQLKDLYYEYVITNDMRRDVQSNLEEQFTKQVTHAMHNKIIDASLNGKGGKEPVGLLYRRENTEEDKISIVIIKKNEKILSKMHELYAQKRTSDRISSRPIWIMSPTFHAAFMNEKLSLNNHSEISKNTFLGMAVFESNLLPKEYDCILADLYNCFSVILNPTLYTNQKEELFCQKIGIKMQYATFKNNTNQYTAALKQE